MSASASEPLGKELIQWGIYSILTKELKLKGIRGIDEDELADKIADYVYAKRYIMMEE